MVASLTHSITQFVGTHGLYAIFVLMAIDAVFPAASELVMLYGGALAAGAFSGQHVTLFGQEITGKPAAYLAVVVAGTLGYLVGSWIGWLVGRYAGREFVERHPRALHLDHGRLERADE